MPKFTVTKDIKVNIYELLATGNTIGLKCPKCGKKYKVGNKFCIHDGSKLVKDVGQEHKIIELEQYIIKELKEYFNIKEIINDTPGIIGFKAGLKDFFENATTKGKIYYIVEPNILKLKAEATTQLPTWVHVLFIFAIITTYLIPIWSSFFWVVTLMGGIEYIISRERPKKYIEEILNSIEANVIKSDYIIPELSETGEISLENETIKCPSCAEIVKIEAKKCRFCGEIFDEKDLERQKVERLNELRIKRENILVASKEKRERMAKGIKQCPSCGKWDVIKAYVEDGGMGDWCPHCKRSIINIS